MTKTRERSRTISLSLRGFASEIEDAKGLFPARPTRFGIKGREVKPGVGTLLKRSFIIYERGMDTDTPWDDAVEQLLSDLGGIQPVKAAISTLKPEFVLIQLTLPIRNSTEQEDRYLSNESLTKLAEIGASLGFAFL